MDRTEDVSRLAKLGESMTCITMAGHPAEDGDALPLDQLEGPLGVEVVHHDQLAPGRGVGHQHGVAAGGVEQGNRQEVGVLGAAARRRPISPVRAGCPPTVDTKNRFIRLDTLLRWVPTAPLGRPVVPEV